MTDMMMTCQQVTQLMSEAMDQKVKLPRRLKMRMHLFLCTYCTQVHEQMQSIRHACRMDEDPGSDETDACLSPEAMARIRCALAEASGKDA